MGKRFTATLPDGSTSRIGWFLWILAGLWVSGLLIQVYILFEALGEIVGIPASPGLGEFLLTSVQALLIAGLLALVVRFARRRLLMPEAVWFAFAAAPVFLLASALRDIVVGEFSIALLAAVPPLASVLIAWLALHFWPDGSGAASTEA